MAGDTPRRQVWLLWRQDDNGHRFLVGTCRDEKGARQALQRYEQGCHKQYFWIETFAKTG